MKRKKLEPKNLTPDQQECYALLCDLMCGEHHVHDIYQFGEGIQMPLLSHVLSTFDFSHLTKLVFLAHDRCIRAAVTPFGANKLAIVLHKRHAREGKMHERHPTIDEALNCYRENFPASN
jgi:hypothetical protein